MVVRSLKDFFKFLYTYEEFRKIKVTIYVSQQINLIIQNKIDNCIVYFVKDNCDLLIHSFTTSDDVDKAYIYSKNAKTWYIMGYRKNKIDTLFFKLNSKTRNRFLNKITNKEYVNDFTDKLKNIFKIK